jgi:putative hydrolase of the HAD superfamily
MTVVNQRLIDHIREHSSPLDPVPTGESKRVQKIAGVWAIVFDIYGTLFISGSGDISLAENEDRSPAIMAALATAGFEILDRQAAWSESFMLVLQRLRKERQNMGIAHPEVHIEEVWKSFIKDARTAGWLAGQGDVRLAIVDHECRVNPCWPMPNLDETLERLTHKGLRLGIVSNAQFYTPLLFPALIGKPHSAYAFESKFCVWSWREREGKPSTALYQKLKDKLEADGIMPEETLYIGNDLRNDIWPAQQLGFQTVLFAGDKRSLRWRKDDPDCKDVRPDFVITELSQIFEILC